MRRGFGRRPPGSLPPLPTHCVRQLAQRVPTRTAAEGCFGDLVLQGEGRLGMVCNPAPALAPAVHSRAQRLWAAGCAQTAAVGAGLRSHSLSDCAQSAPDHSAQRAAHSAEDESVCTPASPQPPAAWRATGLFIRARPPGQQPEARAALDRYRWPRPRLEGYRRARWRGQAV